MKITEALRVEHAAFRSVIEQIERGYSRLETLHEVRLLADLLRRLLSLHDRKETDLLYVAYDHVLEDAGRLQRMSQEHEDFDRLLCEVRRAKTLAQGKRFLRRALSDIKGHIRYEEVSLFPAIERALRRETLETLAEAI